jgi:hypothetical protein
MNTLITILKLIPALIAAIKALEDAAPITGKGKEKLDTVVSIADLVYDSTADLQKDMPKQKLIELIIGTVGKLVGFFNGLGIFSKK